MTISRPDGSVQHVKYMAYWEKQSTGWRALAYKRVPASAAAPPIPVGRVLPTQIAASTADAATIKRYRESLADAERAFSKDAQTMGIGAAFKQYGSPDAANFGSLTRRPLCSVTKGLARKSAPAHLRTQAR